MKSFHCLYLVLTVVVLLGAANLAFAQTQDNIDVYAITTYSPSPAVCAATPTPPGCPSIVEKSGSSPWFVDYSLFGASWPAFSGIVKVTFRLTKKSVKNDNQATIYPASFTFGKHGGSDNVTLQFSTDAVSWADSQTITWSESATDGQTWDIYVQASPNAAGNAAQGQADVSAGDTSNSGNNVNVNTADQKVKFNFTLSAPPLACPGIFNFVWDQAYTPLSSLLVITSKGKVVSSNPGQVSDNILIPNGPGCPTQNFDLEIVMDPSFTTNPKNNPGNAVFTYLTDGYVDPNGYGVTVLTNNASQKQGQKLCITDVTLGENDTFIATVHMDIRSGLPMASGATGTFSGWLANLYPSKSTTGSACSGTPFLTQGASLPYVAQ